MPEADRSSPGAALPSGFVAVPIHPCDAAPPMRVCVIVNERPTASTGPFVRLRETCDATVLLGALTDAAGVVHDWLELWLQNVDGLSASLPALRSSFSNRTLDERWQSQSEALAKTQPRALLRTGWETAHPNPILLDAAAGTSRSVAGAEPGTEWRLCESDEALGNAGLPAYGESLDRYLWPGTAADGKSFVAVTSGAPANDHCREFSDAAGKDAGLLPFNLQGGLLRVVPLAPVELADFADLLSGKPWKGFPLGDKQLVLDEAHAGLDDWQKIQQSGVHLFLGFKGRTGCLVEAFHLKLQLIAEMIRRVRDAVFHTQLPFLNLDGASFRVRLSPVGQKLPLFWTASVALTKTGDAFALPVTGTEAQYFIKPGASPESIFLPQGLGRFVEGSGNVRLRRVAEERGRVVVEGTLVIDDRTTFSPHDLFWIRLPLAQGRVDLYGHCYAADGLARGEVRFRTIEQTLPAETVQALKGAEGVAFARSPFQVVPLLSTPCDLYSLGVLATRVLLVNHENTLPVALDSLLSLAREVGGEGDPSKPLLERVRAVLQRDERYRQELGRHRLAQEALAVEGAEPGLPEELWDEMLALLVRLFPGTGPDSFRRDYGDAPAGALETVFNEPLAALDALLVRTRSLIVIDWTANREIRSVIDELTAKLG